MPWRTVYVRSLRALEFPLWNDWMSTGRAFAADPNAAVFSPMTLLALPFGVNGLGLANVALALGVFLWALRSLGLSRVASVGGTLVLLLSGVYQTLPFLYSPIGAAAPLPILWVAFFRMDAASGADRRRLMVLASLALGLSVFAGEPVVTAVGGVAALLLLAAGSMGTSPRARRESFIAGGAALVLAVGLAAVQILPTLAELRHSARGAMRPEHSALFWSVRPARILTLLEPRLTGDPFAERDTEYWGAGTFDAGNPYYYDLAIGLIPLLFAFAAAAKRQGRVFLALSGIGALAAMGRFLPGFTSIAGIFSIFRYPEKWWIVSTLGLAIGAATGLDQFLSAPPVDPFHRYLRRTAVVLFGLLTIILVFSLAIPDALRRGLWAMGLGAGPTTALQVSALLSPLLLSGVGTMALALLLLAAERRGRLSRPAVLGVLALLFLADGWRRVAGACPAGAPDLYTHASAPVLAVKSVLGGGRFYDDGAESPALGMRRAQEQGGFDPLRPETGVVFGIRYAAENDIDRMMPVASVEASRLISRLPWGEDKLAILRTHGVTVIRTSSPGPDPVGVVEVARFGIDRILRVESPRDEFALLPREDVQAGSPGGRYGAGSIALLERRSHRQRLRVSVGPEPGYLAVARTFDANWAVTIDGSPAHLLRTAGGLSALIVPAGRDHLVELRYRNALLFWGAILSFASALVIGSLFVVRRETHGESSL
ncbi:MAG: hypothetical protein ABIT01_18035 [Thermoanaerobaculia bacterium]